MALTVRKADNQMPQLLGTNVKVAVIEVDFDSSYPTGGEAINFNQACGIKKLMFAAVEQRGGYVLEVDRVNSKIKVYRQKNPADAGGADIPLPEVANAVDLSTALKKVAILVAGY